MAGRVSRRPLRSAMYPDSPAQQHQSLLRRGSDERGLSLPQSLGTRRRERWSEPARRHVDLRRPGRDRPAPREGTGWKGPYMENIPMDPWNNAYIYEYPGKNNPNGYDLSSMGPDGRAGTDDDIANWKQNTN